MTEKNNLFLFSIDLEDVRENVPGGERYRDRVAHNTHRFLDWLKRHGSACTFFTVGKIAERYPELIGEIMHQGHEIACHSYAHTPTDELGKEGFKKDLDKNISALQKAGVTTVSGFRAPIFSITEKTPWAHDVLKEMGFLYSSSVLPARNPLYGWENFGDEPKKLGNGLVEIPMTIGAFGPLRVPMAGGVYFRVLPYFMLRRAISCRLKENKPVLSYFHPYDIDDEQERFMHAGINNSRFYNWLMYYNRRNFFRRLDGVMKPGVRIIPYRNYAETIR